MKLGPKRLGDYCAYVRVGIIVLLAITVIRFLMLPVFGIPYQQGTMYTSSTIALLILVISYTIRASREGGTRYRDILGIVFVLCLSQELMVAAAILIDDLGGINTYFTDPAHGGEFNPFIHSAAHIVIAAAFFILVFWGLGSLILLLFGKRQSAPAA